MSTLPPVLVHYHHVEVRPDLLDGSPVVRDTRVPVRRIWAWHRKGVSVETLVKRYPNLGWAKVISAIAFGHDNTELVEADLDRERALLDADLPPARAPVIPGIALGRPKAREPLMVEVPTVLSRIEAQLQRQEEERSEPSSTEQKK